MEEWGKGNKEVAKLTYKNGVLLPPGGSSVLYPELCYSRPFFFFFPLYILNIFLFLKDILLTK